MDIVDTSSLEAANASALAALRGAFKPMLGAAVGAFANASVRYLPPKGKGENFPLKEIAPRFYAREIFYLPHAVSGKTRKVYVPEDVEHLRSGDLWKVKHYRWYSRRTVWKYHKTLDSAKADAVVTLRGLMRAAQGAPSGFAAAFSLPDPPNIRRLLRKSPRLAAEAGAQSRLSVAVSETEAGATLTNAQTDRAESLAAIAERAGNKAAKSAIGRVVKKTLKQVEEAYHGK